MFFGPNSYDKIAEALKKVRAKPNIERRVGWSHRDYVDWRLLKDAADKAHAKGPFDYTKEAGICDQEEMQNYFKRKHEECERMKVAKQKLST